MPHTEICKESVVEKISKDLVYMTQPLNIILDNTAVEYT